MKDRQVRDVGKGRVEGVMEGKLKDQDVVFKGNKVSQLRERWCWGSFCVLEIDSASHVHAWMRGERGQLNLHEGDECYGEYRTMC